MSLAAFVVANVCENVRLHHLHECLYYRIQEEGNCSRRCILLRNGFFFGGGVGERYGHRWWVYSAGGGNDAHFLCMLTSTYRWMCGENSTGIIGCQTDKGVWGE